MIEMTLERIFHEEFIETIHPEAKSGEFLKKISRPKFEGKIFSLPRNFSSNLAVMKKFEKISTQKKCGDLQ